MGFVNKRSKHGSTYRPSSRRDQLGKNRGRACHRRASNIIGVIVTGEDSDDKIFPMDTPIFSTSARALASKAGDKGTIGAVLDGITDQADSPIIVVRVPESIIEAEQTASVIGTNTNGRLTGLKALAAASQFVGFDPTKSSVRLRSTAKAWPPSWQWWQT